jgi:MFS family permease
MDLSPLRRRDFRLLYLAEAVSFLGTMITYVALPFQIYHLTGSSLAVGLLGLVELVPLLGTAFLGGVMADVVDRRRMGIVTDFGLAAGSGALALAAAATPPVWVLYGIAAWMSAVSGLQRPSMDSMILRLLDKHEMPAAAALMSLRGSLGMIAGPAIGGVLIASAGLAGAYLVDVASYVASLTCLWMICRVPPLAAAAPPGLKMLEEGFRYASGREELIGTYAVDFIAMVFGMPFALFPAIAEQLGGPSGLGLLYAAPAAGALVASVTGSWAPRVHRHGLAVILAAAMWGLAIVAFGFCRTLWPALACLALAGGADAVSGIFRMTMWNQTVPDAVRGRLASIEMVSCASGPLLGHVEAGAMAAAFGVQASVISGGALCIAGVVACGMGLPGLLRYDERHWSIGPDSAVS